MSNTAYEARPDAAVSWVPQSCPEQAGRQRAGEEEEREKASKVSPGWQIHWNRPVSVFQAMAYLKGDFRFKTNFGIRKIRDHWFRFC